MSKGPKFNDIGRKIWLYRTEITVDNKKTDYYNNI